jgi:hypothetical protein
MTIVMDTNTDVFDLAQAATAGAGGQVERAAVAGAQGLDDRVSVLRPVLEDCQQQRIEVGLSAAPVASAASAVPFVGHP